jgi:carbamoyl-phosphate synthase large subunit
MKKFHTLDLDHVGVKAPQFSFSRLKGADPVLGVEMASTGEVACFGSDLSEALLKAMISVGFTIPKKTVCLTIGRIEDKADFLPSARKLLRLGFKLSATEGTAAFLRQHGIEATVLHKARSGKQPNIIDAIREKRLDLVIDIPKSHSRDDITDGYLIRRRAVDSNTPLITNLQIARALVDAFERYTQETLEVKPWSAYVSSA